MPLNRYQRAEELLLNLKYDKGTDVTFPDLKIEIIKKLCSREQSIKEYVQLMLDLKMIKRGCEGHVTILI